MNRIVYCITCGFRIPPGDLESGAAIHVDEQTTYCAKCKPASTAIIQPAKRPGGSRTNLIPVQASNSGRRPQSRPSSRTLNPAQPSKPEAMPAPLPPARKISPLVIVGGGVGLVAVASAIFLLFQLNGGKKQEKIWSGSSNPLPATSAVVVPPSPPASMDREKAAPSDPPESNRRALPGLSMLEPIDVRSDTKNTKPGESQSSQAGPNEVVWIDDELPMGAQPLGSVGDQSWRWVESPIFSGKLSHISNLPPDHERSQHYFDRTSRPLRVARGDMFYTYVYIDPQKKPRELMLQFNYQGTWDHRVYWGEELMNFPGPVPMPKGALPEAGKWIRLEVAGADIGIGSDELLYGVSFDDFGGVAYWDKSGVVRGAAEAQIQSATLAKVPWDKIQGGAPFANFGNKGQNGRACWGRRSRMPFLSATFDLANAPADSATMALFSLRHDWNQGPCHISIKLNGQEIFNGADPATNWNWAEHRFPIPSGILKTGANDVRIDNLEDSDKIHQAPWYMLGSITILAIQSPPVNGNGATAGAANPNSPPAPTPATGTLAPAAAAGMSLAKLSLKDISGGTDHGNFGNKGKTGRAIWGKKNGNSTASGSFENQSGPGPAVFIVNNYPHDRNCQISIEVNGKEIFKGIPPATTKGQWGEQRFDVPDGILKSGRNEFRIINQEGDNEPWYMIDTVEIVSSKPLTISQKLALTAPKKVLESDGALFSSEIAMRIVNKISGKNNKNVVMIAGYSTFLKDLDMKSMGRAWSLKAGPVGGPAQLLVTLPAELESQKPEVVVLVGEAVLTRKLSDIERMDWEDCARLCMRMGAVPVIAIPAPNGKDDNSDLRTIMGRVVNDNQLFAMQMKSSDYFPVQLKVMLGLLEKHVFGREAPAEKEKSKEVE